MNNHYYFFTVKGKWHSAGHADDAAAIQHAADTDKAEDPIHKVTRQIDGVTIYERQPPPNARV